MHRIVRANPDGSYQTKGDANPSQLAFEYYVAPANIHGKVVMIVPYLGWVKIGVMTHVVPNLFYIGALSLLILAVYYLRRFV